MSREKRETRGNRKENPQQNFHEIGKMKCCTNIEKRKYVNDSGTYSTEHYLLPEIEKMRSVVFPFPLSISHEYMLTKMESFFTLSDFTFHFLKLFVKQNLSNGKYSSVV